MADRSHRPRSCPHQLPAAVEALVLELRRSRPYWGPRRLVLEPVMRGVHPVLSESGETLHRRRRVTHEGTKTAGPQAIRVSIAGGMSSTLAQQNDGDG